MSNLFLLLEKHLKKLFPQFYQPMMQVQLKKMAAPPNVSMQEFQHTLGAFTETVFNVFGQQMAVLFAEGCVQDGMHAGLLPQDFAFMEAINQVMAKHQHLQKVFWA